MLKTVITALTMLAVAAPLQAASVAEAMAAPDRLPGDLERDERSKPAAIIELLNIGPGDRVAAFDDHLKSRGLIARRVEGYGLPEHIRISIGDEAACRLVAEAARAF